MVPRVTDNDKDEIIVTLDGKELRGWSYASDTERRQKMLQAREYVEGWCDGRRFGAVAQKQALEYTAQALVPWVRLCEAVDRREKIDGLAGIEAERQIHRITTTNYADLQAAAKIIRETGVQP